MDRVNSDKSVCLVVGAAVLSVLAVKAIQLGWLAARPPPELNGEPALLFFNNERGCDRVLAIYLRAYGQIAAWAAESRHGVPRYRINLKQRPDLRKRYRIVRAPTLAAGRRRERHLAAG